MEIDDNAALQIQELCQNTVVQFRCQDLQEADGTGELTHAEALAVFVLKAAGSDEVLCGQPGGGQPVPVEQEGFLFVHSQDIMENLQTFLAVQNCGFDAQPFEIVEDIDFQTFQTHFCHAVGLGFDTEGQIFGFDQSVVATLQLPLKHLCVFLPDAVKFISLWRDADALGEYLFGNGKVCKGELEFDGRIEEIEEITPCFKDRGFILVLGKLVVDILELDGLGEIGVGDNADAIGHHALIGNTVLRRFFFLIRPVCSCDGCFDLLPFGAGQPLLGGQCGEPPYRVGAAAVTRRRNCWSGKDGASDG